MSEHAAQDCEDMDTDEDQVTSPASSRDVQPAITLEERFQGLNLDFSAAGVALESRLALRTERKKAEADKTKLEADMAHVGRGVARLGINPSRKQQKAAKWRAKKKAEMKAEWKAKKELKKQLKKQLEEASNVGVE